jgi:hypothetical protein
MAGDPGWKTVELQIEALIPGVLVLVELHAAATHYLVATSALMAAGEFVRAVVFVALAYSVGVVSSLLSRALLDSISERGPRMFVFQAFSHHELDDAAANCGLRDPQFVKDNERESERPVWGKLWSWNAVYRSALRCTTRREEVDRRRSQSRFVRNLLVPSGIAPFLFFALPWSVFVAIADILLMAFLYAYAEYVNFAEAYDISDTSSK